MLLDNNWLCKISNPPPPHPTHITCMVNLKLTIKSSGDNENSKVEKLPGFEIALCSFRRKDPQTGFAPVRGSVLVFLPGLFEINKLESLLDTEEVQRRHR